MRLVLLAALSWIWAANAFAQAYESLDASSYPPGSIVLSFEGGVPGTGVAKALHIAIDDGALPTERYAARKGDNVCSVLQARGFPPCDTGLLSVIQRLNPRQKLVGGRLATGQQVVLPTPRIRTYRTVRTFSAAQKTEQSKAKAAAQAWSGLSPSLVEGAHSSRIDLNAYELVITATSPEKQAMLLKHLQPLRSMNVLIDDVAFQPQASKLHQINPDVSTECAAGRVPPMLDYLRLVPAADGDALPAIQRTTVIERPTVVLLDVALIGAPNIATAIVDEPPPPPPARWTTCRWGTAVAASHATHLAGIIASQNNGYGFLGLAPEAKLKSFRVFTPSGAGADEVTPASAIELTLSQRLHEYSTGSFPLRIYLMAAVLKPRAAFEQHGAVSEGRLLTGYGRFNTKFERWIQQESPLLIVSAGQEARVNLIRDISDALPMSPQFLGDQSSVVVVTACTECSKENPALLPTANYSSDGRFVHVAAPGGTPVPGWIDDQKLGAAAGTSQAAAYVAGVAASMISHYPMKYTAAVEVKRRLQITSWPIYRQPFSANTDANKLAAGIVDPNLALLDPSTTWIKRGSTWEKVAIKAWSADSLRFLTPDGTAQGQDTAPLVRFVKVASGPAPLWMLYTDKSLAEPSKYLPGEIGKLGPFTSASDGFLTPCAGNPIPLATVDDLIVAMAGIGPDTCH